MTPRSAPHPRLVLLALVVALVALGACSKKTTAPALPGDPAPAPDTPRHAVDLFRWSWGHKSIDRFRELFTDDLVFTAYYIDTATMAPATFERNRQEIIDSVAMVFATPAAIRLDYLAIDPDSDDPRPGKDPGWHRLINVRFNLAITVPGTPGSYIAHPVEEFFLVRGDSAVIPAELASRGFGPDPKRWYISDWTDRTAITAPQVLPDRANAVLPRGVRLAARPSGWPIAGPPAGADRARARLASAPRVR